MISTASDRKTLVKQRLPSLNALRAFEAAGRHLSFTKAADELHVTPAAVGHQVKALEQDLGVRLFQRLNRALVLTEAGRALLPGLEDIFYQLAVVIEEFKRRDTDRPLTVSLPPSLTAKWLLPRLERFRQLHPEIDVRIDATNEVVDLIRGGVDIGLRYGSGDYPGLRVDCLMSEEVFPVCSPRLLEGRHPLRVPDDLRWHTLLHADYPPQNDYWPDWSMWLHTAGVKDVDTSRGLRFNRTALSLQAAIEVQGVALGSRVLAGDDLKTGRLVRPFELSTPVGFAYYMVCAEARSEEPRVAAFREWIIAEAGTS
jgi:LysR family glycine cleavage system transcriptional activator